MDGRELKQYLRFKDEAHALRMENQHLRCELNACRPELHRADMRIDVLEQHNAKLLKENQRLTQKLADLTAQLQARPKPLPPALIKANVPEKTPKKPGRKPGHPAALRPMPGKIDLHIAVNVPIDTLGKACCPECRSQLSDVAGHQRYVEELVPSKVFTTCYHTTSGWCPSCRRTVESRAFDQPPAADIPHAQLGLNALATAAVMRVCYRLPLRKITQLFAQLPGMKISPGAIVKQIQRLGKWLGKQYHRLKLQLRAAGVVHADETGWRTNGHNGQLWTLTNDRHTLYHVDASRGGGGSGDRRVAGGGVRPGWTNPGE
jgi:transposase